MSESELHETSLDELCALSLHSRQVRPGKAEMGRRGLQVCGSFRLESPVECASCCFKVWYLVSGLEMQERGGGRVATVMQTFTSCKLQFEKQRHARQINKGEIS